MMRLIAVHGINSNGANGVDVLTAAAANHIGIDWVNFDYPRISLLKALWALSNWQYDKVAQSNAQLLFEQSQDGDHVVAHSFGCATVLACSMLGRKFGHVWLVAPAINQAQAHTLTNHRYQSLSIVSNPHDRALKFGTRVPWFNLSNIGLTGPHGVDLLDSRISGYYISSRYLHRDHNDPLNHSYAFLSNDLANLTNDIIQRLSKCQ